MNPGTMALRSRSCSNRNKVPFSNFPAVFNTQSYLQTVQASDGKKSMARFDVGLSPFAGPLLEMSGDAEASLGVTVASWVSQQARHLCTTLPLLVEARCQF